MSLGVACPGRFSHAQGDRLQAPPEACTQAEAETEGRVIRCRQVALLVDDHTDEVRLLGELPPVDLKDACAVEECDTGRASVRLVGRRMGRQGPAMHNRRQQVRGEIADRGGDEDQLLLRFGPGRPKGTMGAPFLLVPEQRDLQLRDGLDVVSCGPFVAAGHPQNIPRRRIAGHEAQVVGRGGL